MPKKSVVAKAKRAIRASRNPPSPYPDDPAEMDLRVHRLVRPRSGTPKSIPGYSRDPGLAMRAVEKVASRRGLSVRVLGQHDPTNGMKWGARIGINHQPDFSLNDVAADAAVAEELSQALCRALIRHHNADMAGSFAEQALHDGHNFCLREVRGLWSLFKLQAPHSEGGWWDASTVSQHASNKAARAAARYLVQHCWEEEGLGWWCPSV